MISVLICTYNRSHSLATALESLGQTHVPDGLRWEVLVVDNNSTDETAAVVARFADEGTLPVRHIVEAEQGLSFARNRGIREAAGDVIAFLDDDVVVSPEWLPRLAAAFDAYAAECVGGPARLDPAMPRPHWWRPEFDGKIGHFDRGDAVIVSRDVGDGMIGIGANVAFRRGVFDRLGFFRAELGRTQKRLYMGDDLDLVNRVRRSGGTAVYDPGVVVEHRPDLSRLTKEYLRRWYTYYGEWDFVRDLDAAIDAMRILGVPRWRYRTAARNALALVKAVLAGRRNDAFGSELRLRAFGGYLRAARRHAFR
jgi:glycosyltransferase involved in cell wall biosynthesis